MSVAVDYITYLLCCYSRSTDVTNFMPTNNIINQIYTLCKFWTGWVHLSVGRTHRGSMWQFWQCSLRAVPSAISVPFGYNSRQIYIQNIWYILYASLFYIFRILPGQSRCILVYLRIWCNIGVHRDVATLAREIRKI